MHTTGAPDGKDLLGESHPNKSSNAGGESQPHLWSIHSTQKLVYEFASRNSSTLGARAWYALELLGLIPLPSS